MIPEPVRRYIAGTSEPMDLLEVARWVQSGARAEDVLGIESSANDLLWAYLAQWLPEKELTPEVCQHLLDRGQNFGLLDRGASLQGLRLPKEKPLAERIREVSRNPDTQSVHDLGREVRALVAESENLPEEALLEVVSAILDPRVPESESSVTRSMRLEMQMSLLAPIGGSMHCTSSVFSRAWEFMSRQSPGQGEMEEWFGNPSIPDEHLLAAVGAKKLPEQVIRAMAIRPALRQHPELRVQIRAQARSRELYYLCLDEPAESFRALWLQLLLEEEDPQAASAALRDRSGPLPLEKDDLLPLLGSPNSERRLLALAALSRLTPALEVEEPVASRQRTR